MNEKEMTIGGRIKKLFSPPEFADDEKTRVWSLLNFLTIFYLLIMVTSIPTVFAFGRENLQANLYGTMMRFMGYVILFILVQVIMRRGAVLGSGKIFVIGFWLITTFEIVTGGGVLSPSFATYLIAVVIAGLVLGARAAMLAGSASMIAGVVLSFVQDRLPAPLIPLNTANYVVSLIVAMIAIMVMLSLYIRRLDVTLGRLRNANTELEKAGQALEQRVLDRTRALMLSTEVSRRLSTILEQDKLIREVVTQLQQSFNYYHVHIYLFDDRHETLMMVGGTGDAGRVMLARGHKIIAGRGLVGRAAETDQPVLVSDTTKDAGWLPNPLLPDTKSELAVPIASGERVLGVLDVQQNRVGGLTTADVDLVQLVSNQVAIALQNAQLYLKTQQRAERDELVVALSQKIQQATTIEDVLKVAVSGLGQGLSAQRSSVELRSPSSDGKH